MKNYEQKYKEALERARDLYNNHPYGESPTRILLEEIFPELAESEDDRIRKWIIDDLKDTLSSGSMSDNYVSEANKAIAWLEKQGEQKPTDKVEPKFKVGDWVMLDRPVLITKVEDMSYNTHQYWTSDGKWFGDATKAKLWNIQDVKDGDVLYSKSSLTGTEYIVMSKGINGYGNIDSYFRYNSAYGFGINVPSVLGASFDDITPATKEQRELLFQKMRESGYEWDADKKELKKIKQTPAWREEDEKFFKTALWHISYSISNGKNTDEHCDTTDWLKSLKERMKGE